jgi:hypothetical protein
MPQSKESRSQYNGKMVRLTDEQDDAVNIAIERHAKSAKLVSSSVSFQSLVCSLLAEFCENNRVKWPNAERKRKKPAG